MSDRKNFDKDPQLSHDYDGPSRSQQRREALAVFELAEALVALSEAQLARVPLSDELRAVVEDTRRITQQIARKRQVQFLAKQLRRREEEQEGIRAALVPDREEQRRETAHMHRLESWRDRLLTDGDEALAALLTEFPHADRQHLRQLIRNALTERHANKPPASARELFKQLRALIEPPEPDDPPS